MTRARAFVIGGAVLAAVLSLRAQESLRVDVRLVTVTATVTDADGRYVNNLTLADFALEEDGVPQKITHFTQDHEVPVSVGILLDTSGSMLARMQKATGAVEHFVRSIHRDDDIFLMTFAARPVIRQDFTSDRQRISQALRSFRLMEGKFDVLEALTAIYDSLGAALEKLRNGRHDKRAVLLITDGQDTWSRQTPETLTKRLGRSEVLVYGLGIPPARPPEPGVRPPSASRDNVNMKTLWQFADSSGGRAVLLSTDDPKRLDQLLSDIATELRNQYTLAYYPSIPEDGRFHKITVKAGDHVVRARNGYYN